MVVGKKPVASALFQARRLAHVNIFVSDLERSMEFYHKVVGLEQVYRKAPPHIPDAPAVAGFLSNGNTHHDIALVARGQQPGLNHLAFELENEVDLLEGYQRSVEAGEEFRPDDHDTTRSLYQHDADGNGIEIYSDNTREWRKIRGDGRTVRDPSAPWTPGDPPRFGPAEARNYHTDPEIRRVEDAVFHPMRTTHAVIVAEDYPAMCRYYTTVVGLTTTSGGLEQSYSVLSGTTGGRHLTLFRRVEGQPIGLHHFGFEVWNDADLEESEVRLQEAGMEPELRLDHATRRSVFIRDPDGLLIEFHVDRSSDATCLDETEGSGAVYLA